MTIATQPWELDLKEERLLAFLRPLESCAVAFSGGVDSAVVAKAAQLALGDRAIAVTAHSPSLAAGELEQAVDLARQIGIRHHVIQTQEFQSQDYLKNSPDRCYHCKTELYTQLGSMRAQFGVAAVVNGANCDDQGDYRPGMQAAREHAVLSPCIEAGLYKADVRALAKRWNLPVWDKPATPCLSSRVAYGLEVTPERVRQIDAAEAWLREQGFAEVRVRLHPGDLARVEVPLEFLPRLATAPLRDALDAHLRTLGFKFVTLDLRGLRSGSLNALVPLNVLPRSAS